MSEASSQQKHVSRGCCPNCRAEGIFGELPEGSRRLPDQEWEFAALAGLYLLLLALVIIGFESAWWLRIVFGMVILLGTVLMTQLPRLTRSWFARVRFCRGCGLAVVLARPMRKGTAGRSMGQLLLFGQSYLSGVRTHKPAKSGADLVHALLKRSSNSRIAEQLHAAVRHIFRIR